VKFTRSGGKTAQGHADWFTGTVYVDGVQGPGDQSTLSFAHVRFTPGARTVWHTHPRAQTLYVTDGIGYVGTRGGNVQEIRPGDVVIIEPGEEHWHGATPAELNDAKPLDAVIQNAGCGAHRRLWPVNIVAPYLLTALLRGPRRLVYLSSGSHFVGRRVD
jgi:quercetin dioxygenase-like cupin family protein